MIGKAARAGTRTARMSLRADGQAQPTRNREILQLRPRETREEIAVDIAAWARSLELSVQAWREQRRRRHG